MTNDTTTLNGALRELGETMAANLTTQGVASTWDEGLTTLAGKILDIQGGGSGYDGISLTGDKSILSAADSEYVTLTAQLMNGQSSAAVSGETVSFKVYKASDDTLIDTLTDDTDSSGVATVSYYGQGTGDLYIKSSVDSIISSEIYVEDCLIARASVSNSDTFDVSLPNHFTFASMITRESSSNSYCYPVLTNYQFGVLREKGSLSIRVGTGSPFADNNTSIVPLNTPTLMTYEYNNGVHTLTANNVTVTGTENTYSIGSFLRMNIQRYTVTDLKIKTL